MGFMIKLIRWNDKVWGDKVGGKFIKFIKMGGMGWWCFL